MVTLSYLHILYVALILVMLILMAFRKSIVLPCVAGILIIGWVATQNAIGGIQALFNALVWAGGEFWGVIAVISLVVAMSKALAAIGADALMIRPFSRYMKNRSVTFLLLGIVMFAVSICIWPSPAVALVGAIILPLALETGIPVVWAAVAMNLFGHGIALSGDYFIQGAPTITAKAADTTVGLLMRESIVLWAVMAVVTVTVAFLMFRRDVKKLPPVKVKRAAVFVGKPQPAAVAMAIITPVAFALDVVLMLLFKLQGGDATALVGGTALIILVAAACLNGGVMKAFDSVIDHLKEGFGFGMEIFTPVIFIAGFFFLGGADGAKAVLGAETGIMNDIGLYLAQNVPISRVPVVLAEALAGFVTGLDGSGFSGLPIVGATASTFAQALPVNKEMLASLGQIITIWVDGGTLIPWAVIPVAAICGVKPEELVRKNVIPVLTGLAATIIVACFLV
ncbi:MAG: hypothetical protein VB049_00750 [Candidatus Pelethousia sp.]|nr:hypothetical protein [Candidatus Pelethousia sp.]